MKHLYHNDKSQIPPYTPPYDTSHFVNEGEFFDTHPGVVPHVTRYEQLDGSGKVIESWERDKNGVMVNVTARDKLYREIADAQDALEEIKAKGRKQSWSIK